eukprot:scaffold14255_cov62-Phaeocystis_antarctica.AAC.1
MQTAGHQRHAGAREMAQRIIAPREIAQRIAPGEIAQRVEVDPEVALVPAEVRHDLVSPSPNPNPNPNHGACRGTARRASTGRVEYRARPVGGDLVRVGVRVGVKVRVKVRVRVRVTRPVGGDLRRSKGRGRGRLR